MPFSRSIRSLEIDSYKASRVGMILAVLITLSILLWFFLAKITIYEFSSQIEFTGNDRILAVFPAESLKKIKIGQPAIINLDLGPDLPKASLSAFVIGIDKEQETAELIIISENLHQIPLSEDLTGQVQVEVEYITPASLIRKASGMYVQNSQYPLSPQNQREEGE
ncbi:MAG: hypothetical protein ACK2U3_15390 [Anaerolineales bacterium]